MISSPINDIMLNQTTGNDHATTVDSMIKNFGTPIQKQSSSSTQPTFLDSSASSLSYCSSTDTESQPLHLSCSGDIDIRVHYEILPKIIGEGNYGIVRECVDKSTGESFAVKSIPKISLKNKQLSKEQNLLLFQREVELLQQVTGHRGIVSLIDVYEDEQCFHIITDLCRGGELFDLIIQQTEQREVSETTTLFSEPQAARMIHSILDSVAHLHKKNIVHRDLKPENFLFSNDQIKLIDFGLSTAHDDEYDSPLTEVIGTPFYMAPEVLKKKYNRACDIWSVGVIAYILLCGRPPFDGQDDKEVFDKIRRGHFSFNESDGVSEEAKDFIKSLLRRDPRRRFTAERAMQHPWMVQNLGGDASFCC